MASAASSVAEPERRLSIMQAVFERLYKCKERVLPVRLLEGLLTVADTHVAGDAVGGGEKSLYKREVEQLVMTLV